jgi:hypothetical protein
LYPDKNWSANTYIYTSNLYCPSEVWLKFDLSSLAPPEGHGLQVNSVSLLSHGPNAGDCGTYQDAAWFCADDTWNQGAITWNNRPTVLGAQLVAPWDYSTTAGMEATGVNLAVLVQQEAIGDNFLSMKVDRFVGGAGYVDNTAGHYYYDNDYSAYGFQIVVDYTFVPGPNMVPTPTFTPDGNTYSNTELPKTVTIGSVAGSEVYYTTNGEDPTQGGPGSTLYQSPITIDRTLTLKAKAWKTGLDSSDVKSSTYAFVYDHASIFPATLNVNGDLSDWPAASVESSPFVFWNGANLISTTKARFAWNDAQDVLYVAVTTNEHSMQPGGHVVIGASKNIGSIPINSIDSTQLCFDYDVSKTKNVWIRNECDLYGLSGTTTGVDAACSKNGDNYTYEIAIPLWSNWVAGTGLQTLTAGNTVYVYVVMEDEFMGGNGTNLSYYGNPNFAGAGFAHAAVLTLQASAQIPGDANSDGMVDVGDLGILAANYGGTGKTWAQGDFNNDHVVDVGDLGILAAHYGQGSTNPTSFSEDYTKAFGATVTNDTEDDATTNSSICSALGLPLVAGLMLAGLMLMGSSKLED